MKLEAPLKPQQHRDRWREYELRKAEWWAKHPEAAHQEYQQAMQRIARACGV